MNEITGAMAVVGIVNGLNFAVKGEWESFAKFVFAIMSGMLFGYLNWFGIKGLEAGLAVALASSGIFKISQQFATYRQA